MSISLVVLSMLSLVFLISLLHLRTAQQRPLWIVLLLEVGVVLVAYWLLHGSAFADEAVALSVLLLALLGAADLVLLLLLCLKMWGR